MDDKMMFRIRLASLVLCLGMCASMGIVSSAWADAENIIPDADGCMITDKHHVFMGKERCIFGVESGDVTHAHLSGRVGNSWLSAAAWVAQSSHMHLVLTLDSDGGNMDTAAVLADAMLRHGDVETVVRTGESCSSACTTVWLAGSLRTMEPKSFIAFHGVTCHGTCRVRDIEHGRELERKILRAAQVREPELARHLVNNDVFRLHGNEAVGFQRDRKGHWLSVKVE